MSTHTLGKTIEKNHEHRVRQLAARRGYSVHKSRQAYSGDNYGDYMLVDAHRNTIELGEKYNATLAGIEHYLKEG